MNLQTVSLRELIVLAWDLSPNDKEVPVGAPKWLDSEKFDIHAKISNDSGMKNPPLVPFTRVRDPDTSASVPNGAVSVFDAVNHQLGLKLEKQKRPLPVLVIDHIEQKPTEN